MQIACLDLEGVLVPEIWMNVAKHTRIDALLATTRDISDYNELMRQRLDLLKRHNLTLVDIQSVIAKMSPLPGAYDFLNRIRETFQIIILSDTFYDLATPLMKQLGNPTLFCHRLHLTSGGRLEGYQLRMPDQKRAAVKALHQLNFKVIAAGDSYNDTTMLAEADAGILFRPPQNVADEFPQFPMTTSHDELYNEFIKASSQIE